MDATRGVPLPSPGYGAWADRGARGKRYSLQTVLVLAVAARIAGYRGVTAFAQFAALLDQDQRQAVGCFFSPSKQCYTTPNTTTFHNIMAALPPDTLDEAVGAWARQLSEQAAEDRRKQVLQQQTDAAEPPSAQARASTLGPFDRPPVCMDGKDVRGASKQTPEGRRMLVAGVEHGTGLVLGQLEIDSKTNEIPALRELAPKLKLAGRIATYDPLHCQHETARVLLEECQAHYVVTGVKDNQPTIARELREMDFTHCPMVETYDKEHGRRERRWYWIKDLSGPQCKGKANLYGRKQAIRIKRERRKLRRGKVVKTSVEVSYALTSLSPAEASPEQLADLIRNHRHIENRLHYVRDFTYDEDRCRVYVRDLPRNLACLSNAAISIIRCQTHFRYVPVANRHFAARQQEVLDLLMQSPNP
ncbi:MAG: ISAs1 family transposase, partial [Bryobacterales bacterium]|nr:ISAs1 family transposase [Bryobacterales bacterium]